MIQEFKNMHSMLMLTVKPRPLLQQLQHMITLLPPCMSIFTIKVYSQSQDAPKASKETAEQHRFIMNKMQEMNLI